MEQQQQQQPPADLSLPVGSSLQELYAQLVQKERDLLLAAQLGKALLEKNEELGLQNEKMAEEYSRQLEVSACFWLDDNKKPKRTKKNQLILFHWRHPRQVSKNTIEPSQIAESFLKESMGGIIF